MSDDSDRFESVDRALDEVREELDEAVEGTKEAGSKASKEVREALDSVEKRLGKLRDRNEE
ncbi:MULTISPECIES: hypothetical protein [unclassified Haloparvum]|uniref:hypothetical protein n=1 Tax=Haloparvum sp. PAK95 TaxID=3418962 RepID=UPI003D2EC02E